MPFSLLKAGACFIALVLLLPLIYVFLSWLSPEHELWKHLASTVLSDYLINSALLALSSAVGSIFLGLGSAYMVTRFDFFGRRTLQVALILPLAMPAYIIAYTYTGLLDFAGPVQVGIREVLSLSSEVRVLPDIRNLSGASVMLILVLYPYVYMLSRAALSHQSQDLSDISRLFGHSRWRHFFKVELPLIRPAVLGAAALVMMEALADYGTVAYFGVNTFSTGIYRTWFGMGNQGAAAQLASLLCLCVFVVLYLEQKTRRDAAQYQMPHKQKSKRKALKPWQQCGVFGLCLLPILLGFIVPLVQLVWWALFVADNDLEKFLSLLSNTFYLAALASVVIVTTALFFAWLARMSRARGYTLLNKTLALGYALPGIVIAVGVIAVAGTFDRSFNKMSMALFDWRPGLILSGSIAILVFAYAVRYISVALQGIESGFTRLSQHLEQTALILDPSKWRLFLKIQAPLLSSSIFSALLLVFVDVLKELPATLVLRPFNFNTLAVRAYELASDERLIDAALPAISIVLIGLLPVCLLMWQLERGRH